MDVSPDAAEWELELEVTVTSQPTEARFFVALLNVEGGTESAQFSGGGRPITLRAGETVEPEDVDLVRGPLDNLFVTDVEIASAVVETTATTTGDEYDPQVYLTPLDSTILATHDSTVTGLLPDDGRFVASAGAFSNTASIHVKSAPATTGQFVHRGDRR